MFPWWDHFLKVGNVTNFTARNRNTNQARRMIYQPRKWGVRSDAKIRSPPPDWSRAHKGLHFSRVTTTRGYLKQSAKIYSYDRTSTLNEQFISRNKAIFWHYDIYFYWCITFLLIWNRPFLVISEWTNLSNLVAHRLKLSLSWLSML